MTKLVNRAKMTTATTGTGTITLGFAVDGFQAFLDAGVADGNTVRYVIEDNTAWEIGTGTYTAGTPPLLSRTPSESSSEGAPINLSGNAKVYLTAAAADLQELVDFADNFVLPTADGSTGQVLTTNGAGTLSFTTITGYTDADVDAHLNTSTAASGEVLSWNGSDYDWVTSGGAFTADGSNNLYAIATLPALTTGSDNFAAGNLAGNSITSGFYNVAIGTAALYNATTSYGSTFIGYNAGYNANSIYSIGIGIDALKGDATGFTGHYNIGLGFRTGYDLTTGTSNFISGYQAGTNLTTGSYNVAIGYNALDGATTGGRNIAIGQQAMGLGIATAAPGDNVAIGYQAGYDLTSGTVNTLVGQQAGANLTTGNNNVAIGTSALLNLTTFSANVAIGPNAAENFNDDSSVFVGSTAGRFVNGTGSQETVAIGKGALLSSTAVATGFGNTAIGTDAGKDTTSGSRNTYIGRLAGQNVTTGGGNTIAGHNAASTLTTGGNNTVLGEDAEPSSATVSNEITLGNSSITRFRIPGIQSGASDGDVLTFNSSTGTLELQTPAGGATSIDELSDGYYVAGSLGLGAFALSSNEGSANQRLTAVGAGALQNHTTGLYNVAFGYAAGDNTTTGVFNTYLGTFSGSSNTVSSENTGVGYSTLQLASGANNTAIGSRAMNNFNNSGSDNVAIGKSAGDLIQTGSNNIVIGTGADPSSSSVSNEITLGTSSHNRFRIPGAGIDNTSAALSGTTPSVDVGARDTYTLTTSGSTTFTFTGAPSSGQVGTFSLIITAGGTHTLTWPASVKWAIGTAPEAPASGETDIYTFMTIDGGTTWYGFLAGEDMS